MLARAGQHALLRCLARVGCTHHHADAALPPIASYLIKPAPQGGSIWPFSSKADDSATPAPSPETSPKDPSLEREGYAQSPIPSSSPSTPSAEEGTQHSSSTHPTSINSPAGTPLQVFSTAELYTDANANVPLKSAHYPSSFDDPFGVQRNWFTSLYKQLNYIAKTGQVKSMSGRQKEVFQQVESEFEALYNKYVKDKSFQPSDHRSMLMCCLSVATYRILNDEIEDTKLVREIIRTNLGAMMISLLRPIHRFKLWVLRHILREDMYRQAVDLLPVVLQDMGNLVERNVEGDDKDTTLTVTKCAYSELLTQEETPFLLSEFCCHHALLWMHEYRRHGVVVSMDNCMAWDDSCCQLRLARPGQQVKASAESGIPAAESSKPSS